MNTALKIKFWGLHEEKMRNLIQPTKIKEKKIVKDLV